MDPESGIPVLPWLLNSNKSVSPMALSHVQIEIKDKNENFLWAKRFERGAIPGTLG